MGSDSLAIILAFTLTVNPYCRCFMGKDVIYWSGSGFFFSLFHTKRNLTSCCTQTSQAVPMGLMESWRSSGQNMQRRRSPTNPITAI